LSVWRTADERAGDPAGGGTAAQTQVHHQVPLLQAGSLPQDTGFRQTCLRSIAEGHRGVRQSERQVLSNRLLANMALYEGDQAGYMPRGMIFPREPPPKLRALSRKSFEIWFEKVHFTCGVLAGTLRKAEILDVWGPKAGPSAS
jgi:hypothetical protein